MHRLRFLSMIAAAGFGAFNVRSSYDGATNMPNASETDFGINGGAGVALRLGPIDGFVEARMSDVYTKQAKFSNVKAVQFVPVTFGFVF